VKVNSPLEGGKGPHSKPVTAIGVGIVLQWAGAQVPSP